MAADEPVTFGSLLREMRTGARVSQRSLAEAAGLSYRTVSDLERGVATTPQKDTVRLLADALGLIGPARAQFEAIARGRDETGGVPAATRTLPRDTALFTGRRQELQQLLTAAANAGGVVGIHAIGGMAGVGKTALAVHAAHRLAPRFPDGQIFLPLHGHTPGQKPVDPEEALASLLLIIGVAPGQIPLGLTARTALWRDRLAGRRLLLILDDAASSEQLHPLLPGSGDSVVLVTSRHHLSALDEATTISLDTLPADEAAALLVGLTGRTGLRPDEPAVGQLIRLCGFLPLAIAMVARQLHHHPAWSLANRAAELASAHDRLELMAAEKLSVAAAFDLSYADLDPDLRQLFRRLGLHPGSEVDAYAAAALDSSDLAAARRGLEALYDHYLLAEPEQGRYRMHDLIRQRSRALAEHLDSDQRDVLARLLDYYQATAARADALITPYTRPGSASTPAVDPEVPVLAGNEGALAWLRAERASLLACLDHVTEAGEYARVTALTAGLASLLRFDGPWADAVARHEAAVTAAQALGDRRAHANALFDLGYLRQLAGDHAAAADDLQQALFIYGDLGERLGAANALSELGFIKQVTDNYPEAARDHEEALRNFRDIGDRLGLANGLRRLGIVRCATGDYPAAGRALEEALGLYRDIGNRMGEGNTLNRLGVLREFTGDYSAAALALEEALSIHRDLGNRLGVANCLFRLGNVRWQKCQYPAAARSHAEALRIYREIGNRLGEANALSNLGATRRSMGDYPAAVRDLDESLVIYREIGNRLGEANALTLLGGTRRSMGDYPAAVRDLDEAVVIHRDVGNQLAEATALTELAATQRLRGDLAAATRTIGQALAIHDGIGDQNQRGRALNEAGTIHLLGGDVAAAERCHQQALDLASAVPSPLDQAHATTGLGRCALAGGDTARARVLLRRALETYERLGTSDAAALHAELDALGDTSC